MHLILLSGGSGKRLWPLSNDIRSKQFLKVLPGKKNLVTGEILQESMVQRVYRQLKTVGGWDSITVAAGASQRDQLELQLGKDVNIVIEPERRDTFPAIALACAYLYGNCNVGRDAVVGILPVDSFVDIEFFRQVKEIESSLKETDADLILLGAKPLFASEKYGYIIPKKTRENGRTAVEVASFKEKPVREQAQAFIKKGGLWNCGVFGLTIGYVLKILEERYGICDFSYSNMQEAFKSLPKASFDYEVVETAENIWALKYDGKWKDLGTWETLASEMANKITGNVITDDKCKDTCILNEREIPVAVMGIEGAVVVASNDGILVASKGETYKLKDLMSELKVRPRFEEKRWGTYTVVEHTIYDNGDEALTKKLLLRKGQQISYQYHNNRKEIWSIIRGSGLLFVNGEKNEIKAGDVVSLKEGDKHGIKALTDLEIIEVQLGSPLIEEDIVRLQYDWE